MNDGTGLQYFPSTSSGHRLTDHLGSVVATTDSTGTLISQQRYLPFGGVRTNAGSISQTDYGYTGQRNLDSEIGLMDYKARFYSPYINRFIQPDTLIPSPANPQAFNRYTYVLNSPTNFNDPTGHVCSDPDDETGFCEGSANVKTKVGNKMLSGNGKSIGLGNCGGFGQKKCRTSTYGPPAPQVYVPPTSASNSSTTLTLPSTATLHPLDGNVVNQEPIYDNSYPPKIIGNTITSYAYDDYDIDYYGLTELIPFPFNKIFNPKLSGFDVADAAFLLLEAGIKEVNKQLTLVGMTLVCEWCGAAKVALGVGSSINAINEAITFDTHLRTHDVYFSTPPSFTSPLNPFPFP